MERPVITTPGIRYHYGHKNPIFTCTVVEGCESLRAWAVICDGDVGWEGRAACDRHLQQPEIDALAALATARGALAEAMSLVDEAIAQLSRPAKA